MMSIAKGRSNCEAERELVLQGFNDELQILADSKTEQENYLKSRLYDIITDNSLCDEEKKTQSWPLLRQLQEIEERHIRIMRSVFIGLYSFWELSLRDLSLTYLDNDCCLKKQMPGVKDYLNKIYRKNKPESIESIGNNIREFRNYLVHGSMNSKRESLINELMKLYPGLMIRNTSKDFYISDYSGLKFFLELLTRELNNAENNICENAPIKDSKSNTVSDNSPENDNVKSSNE